MFKLALCIFVIFSFFGLDQIRAQQDLNFCDIRTIIPDKDNLPRPIEFREDRVLASIEYTNSFEKVVTEVNEFYDGANEYGSAISTTANQRTITYVYAALNELLLVDSNYNCRALRFSEAAGLTPFDVFFDGEGYHINTPLNTLLGDYNITYVYVGSLRSIRGIPVKEWKACAVNSFGNFTTRITISFSDERKWSSAQFFNGKPASIPVQVEIESKPNSSPTVYSQIYTVTDFKFLGIDQNSVYKIQEEFYFPQNGIYCPGRINTKPIPEIPDSFIFSAQIAVGEENQRSGNVSIISGEYDYKYNLFALGYQTLYGKFAEVTDFNTGLKYFYNLKNSSCSIEKIDVNDGSFVVSSGSDLLLSNPYQFFLLDNNTYQYGGLSRFDGVNTDVYIAPLRDVKNTLLGTLEYHFVSEYWNNSAIYGSGLNFWPIGMKVNVFKTDPTTRQTTKQTFNYFIPLFLRSGFALVEYDLKFCNLDLVRQYFTFRLSSKDIVTVKKNLNQVLIELPKYLQQVLKVTMLRISDVQVLPTKKYINVFFTLYERANEYGPVEPPAEDVPLSDAVQNLKDAFKRKNFKFQIMSLTDSKLYDVNADYKSLKEIDNYNEGFINVHQNGKGYSSGAVAGITIAVTLLGIAIGGFFIFLEKTGKINISFLKKFY